MRLHHRGENIRLLNATTVDVRRQERAVETVETVETPAISLGPALVALVADSLCRGPEKIMMRESVVQIGNPD